MNIHTITKSFLAIIVVVGMITASNASGTSKDVDRKYGTDKNQPPSVNAEATAELTFAADDIAPMAPTTLRITPNVPPENDFLDISVKSSITHVQPMTGIVLWTDSNNRQTDAIQLEYAYMKYSDIISRKGQYNWQSVDDLLDEVASRGHQGILRFYYVEPGDDPTTVPQYIKKSDGYNETQGMSEGEVTWFPDWSFAELRAFTLDFYKRFAERYDGDPRLAFLQVGFGLWAEYHIYSGPMTLGKTFPSKAFQADFIRHMDKVFKTLRWNISIDAAESNVGPFSDEPELLNRHLGLFDDSFLHKTHHEYNADCFKFFDYQERHKTAPMGGELSYYTYEDDPNPDLDVNHDQIHALDPNGPHGIPFEQLAAQYHISYMIGNDQPKYQLMPRIEEAGMATGYKFKVTSFKASSSQSKVVVQNIGIAPIYYDAYPTVNGVRATASLKGLLQGESKEHSIPSGGETPALTIECDRLVPEQTIEFEADL